jgi:hypothetical protein
VAEEVALGLAAGAEEAGFSQFMKASAAAAVAGVQVPGQRRPRDAAGVVVEETSASNSCGSSGTFTARSTSAS